MVIVVEEKEGGDGREERGRKMMIGEERKGRKMMIGEGRKGRKMWSLSSFTYVLEVRSVSH